MAKYIGASKANQSAGSYKSFGCSEAVSQAAGSAVVYDAQSGACWRVTGMAIPIGETRAGHQEGFEIFNRNMQAIGTSEPVPTQMALPGPIMV